MSAAPRAQETKAVVVIGGGLAGIAAAAALASRGHQVTLLEATARLGGRASSFADAESGLQLDNCQHVLLRCCTNLLDLYERLGVETGTATQETPNARRVRWHRTVHFMDAGGRMHDLTATPGLPAPLHMLPAILRFSLLSVSERVALSRAMTAILRLGRSGREKLESVSFGEWLEEHRQPAALVERFYEPVLISALNEKCRLASAKYALQVFQDAMLAHRDGYIVGTPSCPLSELYQAIPKVAVRLNARVESLVWEKAEGFRVTGATLRDGETLRADAVVLATNHPAVSRFVEALPEPVRAADGRFAGLAGIQAVPILGAHLWFDRPVLAEHAVALTAGPLEWLFRKDEAGTAVQGVISAAREWEGVRREEALARFEEQIRRTLPAAREARLVRGVTVLERRATFAPLPGTDRLRPAQGPSAEGVQGLYLAGDYTRTGWPATMEGAVRSGYLAASAVAGHDFLVPDLPTEWPGRWMGL